MNAISLNAILLNEIPLNIKMNEIVNKFLLVGDKFMPEMHLKQLGCTYSGCGPFTKMNLIKLVFSMIWVIENQKI